MVIDDINLQPLFEFLLSLLRFYSSQRHGATTVALNLNKQKTLKNDENNDNDENKATRECFPITDNSLSRLLIGE